MLRLSPRHKPAQFDPKLYLYSRSFSQIFVAPFQLSLVFELADFLKTQLVTVSKQQSQTESLLCLGVRT